MMRARRNKRFALFFLPQNLNIISAIPSIDLLKSILNSGVIIFGVRSGEELGCVKRCARVEFGSWDCG